MRWVSWVVETSWVMWPLVIFILVNALLGYLYWYGDSLRESPFYFWPFVPDSPLSVTLLAFFLLALHYRRPAPLLGLMAVTGCVKYGLWTVWYWFTNYLSGGSYDLEAIVLSLNHLAMVIGALLLLPLFTFGLREVVITGLWYGLNDLVDYVLGLRPRVPNPEDIELIAGFAVGTTIVLTLIWLVMALKRAPGEALARGPGQREA
jgi:uncharacterized membrane protein YpjA